MADNVITQQGKRRQLLSETDAIVSPPGSSLYPKTAVISRAASTPEISLENRNFIRENSTKEKDSCKRKYSRPRSVSFHPNIRLYYAATTNDLDEVKMLIESGMADVNASNPAEGATALHGASYEGSLECVRYLLEKGANVNLSDDDGWTPLHAAVCGKKRKCVDLLLKASCDPFAETLDGLTPFQMAIEMGSDKLLRQFVKRFSSLMKDESVRESLV